MKKLILSIILVVGFMGCGEKPKPEVECAVQVQQIGTLAKANEQLQQESIEKDKKITWLRKKAKDAGADLTK
jgi:hypothetical protein